MYPKECRRTIWDFSEKDFLDMNDDIHCTPPLVLIILIIYPVLFRLFRLQNSAENITLNGSH